MAEWNTRPASRCAPSDGPKGPAHVDVAEELPRIGRVDDLVVPLLGEQEVGGGDRVLFGRGQQVGFGEVDVVPLGQGVHRDQHVVAGRVVGAEVVQVADGRDPAADAQTESCGDLLGLRPGHVGVEHDHDSVGQEHDLAIVAGR